MLNFKGPSLFDGTIQTLTIRTGRGFFCFGMNLFKYLRFDDVINLRISKFPQVTPSTLLLKHDPRARLKIGQRNFKESVKIKGKMDSVLPNQDAFQPNLANGLQDLKSHTKKSNMKDWESQTNTSKMTNTFSLISTTGITRRFFT